MRAAVLAPSERSLILSVWADSRPKGKGAVSPLIEVRTGFNKRRRLVIVAPISVRGRWILTAAATYNEKDRQVDVVPAV